MTDDLNDVADEPTVDFWASPRWGVQPGESLIGTTEPHYAVQRLLAITHLSGLDQVDPLVADTIRLDLYLGCSYPLPVLGPEATDVPLAKYLPINEHTLAWFGHPLFWLAGDALRFGPSAFVSDDEDENFQHEDDIEAAIRLAISLELAGYYSSVTGTWVDVLLFNGFDVSDPANVQRLIAWQQGAPDPLLDSINVGQDLMRRRSSDDDMAPMVMALYPVVLSIAGYAAAGDIVELQQEPVDAQWALDRWRLDRERFANDVLSMCNIGFTYLMPFADVIDADGDALDWPSVYERAIRAVAIGDELSPEEAAELADIVNQSVQEALLFVSAMAQIKRANVLESEAFTLRALRTEISMIAAQLDEQ